MDKVLNFELLSHPYNWLIVILVLAIGVYGLTLLAAPLGQIGGMVSVA